MKSYSLFKQPTFIYDRTELRINFNHESFVNETDFGTETQWVCDQVLVSVNSSREQLVESINIIDSGIAEQLADQWLQYKIDNNINYGE